MLYYKYKFLNSKATETTMSDKQTPVEEQESALSKARKLAHNQTPILQKISYLMASYVFVIGLGFVNVILFGIPYFIAWTILFFLWIFAILFGIHEAYELIKSFIFLITGAEHPGLFHFFFQFGFAFLAFVGLMFMNYITKFLFKIFAKHVEFCIKISEIKK